VNDYGFIETPTGGGRRRVSDQVKFLDAFEEKALPLPSQRAGEREEPVPPPLVTRACGRIHDGQPGGDRADGHLSQSIGERFGLSDPFLENDDATEP